MDFFSEDYGILEEYLGAPLAGRERRAASLTEAGEATLPDILNARRMELYWPILWERMRPELETAYPLAAISAGVIPKRARQDALRRALEDVTQDGGAALYAEYTELARINRLVCAGFERFIDEVFQTIEEKRAEIAATFFGGRDFGKVNAARPPKTTDARTRPDSRMTLYLETEGGGFYFKPRVFASDGALFPGCRDDVQNRDWRTSVLYGANPGYAARVGEGSGRLLPAYGRADRSVLCAAKRRHAQRQHHCERVQADSD